MAQPVMPVPADDRPADAADRWRAGTLVYTGGGLAVLFLLLLAGDFAWSVKERSVGAIFQLLLKRYEASDLLVGLLMGAVPSAISMVLGPVFSVWSDRCRTRWGRRIPFLLVPTPFIVLSMAGLGFSPAIGAWAAGAAGFGSERAWILAAFAACWTVFEVFTIVANAVFTGLVADVVPRAVIGRFFGLFRAVSLGAGIIFNGWVIGYAEVHYLPLFLALAAIYGVGFTVMCLRVREGAYPPPEPAAGRGPVAAVRDYVVVCGGLGYYRLVFLVIAAAALAFVPVNAFSLYAARSYGLSVEAYGQYTAASFLCSLVLAWPLGWLTDRHHPMRTGAVTLGLYGAAMLAAWLFARGPAGFGIAWAVHVVLSGAFFTATAGLGIMLFPRLRFTQFASAAAVATGLGTMAFTPAFGWALDLTGNDYSVCFLVGAAVSALALALWLVLDRRFRRLGGVDGYRAPEPTPAG